MDENKNLPDALIESIKGPAGKEVLKDLAEAGIDQAFRDGFLKDVPIIGVVARICEMGAAVRDTLFVRKVGRFLLSLYEVPQEERERFVRDLETKPEDKKKVSEALLLLLDRLDDMDKPQILARLFVPYLKGEFPLETFSRLATVLDRTSRWALSQFKAICEWDPTVRHGEAARYDAAMAIKELASLATEFEVNERGVTIIDGGSALSDPEPDFKPRVTKLGWIFYGCAGALL